MPVVDTCDACLRRTDLVAGIAGRLDVEWRRRRGLSRVLSLPDSVLLDLDPTGAASQRHRSFHAERARTAIRAAGLSAFCRCSARYPDRLRELEDPPAILHVAGAAAALYEPDSVALVGARRATPYGLEVARGLGRALAQGGIPVVSGLALGVDAAAHAGAVEGEASPIAVLAGGADVPYPARMRQLYESIVRRGCVVSEMPPRFGPHRWCFISRNRVIAGLSAVTVVIEAASRSGSLSTADFAAQLGRTVAAVPGPVTSALSSGTNSLLAEGAALVRDARDVVEQLSGDRVRWPPSEADCAAANLTPRLRRVLDAVGAGHDTVSGLSRMHADQHDLLVALTELELLGLVTRHFGGRYARTG